MEQEFDALQKSADQNKELYKYECPNPELLEHFETPKSGAGANLVINICAPEFSSLCPITGQPDFGIIRIKYVPDKVCVESKSLKLYLMGYRQFGSFHESIVQQVCDDLVALLLPRNMIVTGEFAPRGGIAFHPTAEYHRDRR